MGKGVCKMAMRGAIMEEMEDKRLIDKEKRKALECQALEDSLSGLSPRGRSGQRSRRNGPSYTRSQSRDGSRDSRSSSRDGFGRDNSRRSKLAKWFSCFKTPRSALSHAPEDKNTSCTTEHGTTKRLRRLWKCPLLISESVNS